MSTEAPAHDSAHKHVAGSAAYVDDLPVLPGQLYVAVGYADIACGTVQDLDLSAVRVANGVVDVLTAEDLPGSVDIGPVYPGDRLLSMTVEFHGQPVFAVAATSQRAARTAVQAAEFVCNEHEPLLSLEQAIADKDYVRPPYRMQKGDVDKELVQAPHRLQGCVRVGGQEHFYLEGQVARAVPDEDGGVTVASSNQNPTEAQKLVAEVLAVPMRKVTIITRRMGGGFGGKETQAALPACLAALFAVRNQCSVVCRWSRRDDMVLTGKRHPFINHYDVGFDDDGRVLAVRYQLAAQCGCSPDLSDAIVDRAMFHCDNAYYLPAADINGLRCRSNTVSNTAFRGFGGPQGMMAAETLMDHIAYHLNKDPLEIRKLNFYGDTERNITPYRQRVHTFTVPRLVRELEMEADYLRRCDEIDAFNAENTLLKRGIALTPVKFGISFTVRHLNQAGALLHLYTDGSLMLNHGGTEMGQGLMIKVAAIVAAEFGVDSSEVQITSTRTDKVPNTSPTAASAGTDLNGMAALDAARTIKQRLLGYLALKYRIDADKVVFKDGQVYAGDQVLTLQQLALAAYQERIQLSATGFYRTPDIHYDRAKAAGEPYYYFANGAAVSEVIVDTLTGEMRLLRTDIIHDVGSSINAAIDIGQIEGGFVQGLGWLTTEQLMWDEQGRLRTDGPATYKIPAISDRPDIFNVRLLADAPNPKPTVSGSKAVGEPPLMLAISVWSAVRHAIASVNPDAGFPALQAPATAEEILRTIDRQRGAQWRGDTL